VLPDVTRGEDKAVEFKPESHSRTEFITEAADLATGFGILLLPLAPLAVPVLALTALAMLPLLLLGVVGVLLGTPLVALVGGFRRVSRRSRAAEPSADPSRPSVSIAQRARKFA
jgi:hypothetical protein